MTRPTADELLALAEEGTLEERARADMKAFCFRVERREGRDKIWFGEWTVTVNRNSAFNFFTTDVRDDPGLEPFPVIRAERTEVRDVRVRPDPDDPSVDYVVPAFFLAAPDYRAAVESMGRINDGYGEVRLLADAWFADEYIVKLLSERLMGHPAVQADRASDWPPLLR
jgi:hypothetical protein